MLGARGGPAWLRPPGGGVDTDPRRPGQGQGPPQAVPQGRHTPLTQPGFHAANADNRQHHQPLETYPNYLTTGHFVEATAENWESEFLQMSGYIFLTAFLRQRGSPESKPLEGDETDEDPRDARDRPGVRWPVRRGGLILTLYEHSFALVLFVIFLACFTVHAMGGAAEFNSEQLAHGGQAVSVLIGSLLGQGGR